MWLVLHFISAASLVFVAVSLNDNLLSRLYHNLGNWYITILWISLGDMVFTGHWMSLIVWIIISYWFWTNENSCDLLLTSFVSQVNNFSFLPCPISLLMVVIDSTVVFVRLYPAVILSLSVFVCQVLSLLISESCQQLKLFGPDVTWSGQVEDLLPCRVYYHWSYLVSWKVLVLEAILLLYHFIKNVIAFLWNCFCSDLILDNSRVILAFKKHTVSQEHLNKVDGHDETKIPAKEIHEMPLGLNNFCVSWNQGGKLVLRLIELLDVVDEHQLVIDLIIFWGNKEACSQIYRYNTWAHSLNVSLWLRLFIQKEPVQ